MAKIAALFFPVFGSALAFFDLITSPIRANRLTAWCEKLKLRLNELSGTVAGPTPEKVLLILLVAWLVIKYPQNLVFTEKSHIQLAALFGAKDKPLSVQAIETLTSTASPTANSEGQLKMLGRKDDGQNG